jgi:hypothetical protein
MILAFEILPNLKMSNMENREPATAMYLAGHGSKTKPRMLELQYQRILRYRRALLKRYDMGGAAPVVFIDLRLPAFGLGRVDIAEVPQFKRLCEEVQNRRFEIVYIDLDEVRPGLTPDYESAFVRSLLEAAGATVLNAFTDDRDVFVQELKARCGQNAREYEVTDGSDIVNFFPSLASDITANALRKELEVPANLQSQELQRIYDRIEGLKRRRPYAGGGVPFVEDRLSAEWRRPKLG